MSNACRFGASEKISNLLKIHQKKQIKRELVVSHVFQEVKVFF